MRREFTSTTAVPINPGLPGMAVAPTAVSGFDRLTADAVAPGHGGRWKAGCRRAQAALGRWSAARGRGVWLFALLVLLGPPWLALRPLPAFGLNCLVLLGYLAGQLAFGAYGPDGKL